MTNDLSRHGTHSGLALCGSGDLVRLPGNAGLAGGAHALDEASSHPSAVLRRSLAYVDQLARDAALRPKPQPDPVREDHAQAVRAAIMGKVFSLGWAGGRS